MSGFTSSVMVINMKLGAEFKFQPSITFYTNAFGERHKSIFSPHTYALNISGFSVSKSGKRTTLNSKLWRR